MTAPSPGDAAPRLPKGGVVLAGFSGRALMFVVFVTFPSLPVAALVVALAAVVLEPSNPIMLTVYQQRIPQELRGRVFGVLVAVMASVRPVGLLVYGFLIEFIGLRETLIVMACINVFIPIALLMLPTLRLLDTAKEQPVPISP